MCHVNLSCMFHSQCYLRRLAVCVLPFTRGRGLIKSINTYGLGVVWCSDVWFAGAEFVSDHVPLSSSTSSVSLAIVGVDRVARQGVMRLFGVEGAVKAMSGEGANFNPGLVEPMLHCCIHF